MSPEQLEQYLERVAIKLEQPEYDTALKACDDTIEEAAKAGERISQGDFHELYQAALDRFIR